MKNYTVLACVESTIVHPTKFYGRFELGRFATGQALTVANTLRRSLLSQLPGVSMTLVQIENVLHEYETVLGIQECALDIILNLKHVVLTAEFEMFSPQIGFINVKGPAIVRASDLKLPFFITCVNPNQYIATLTEKGELNLTVLINCGKNYLNHTPSSMGYQARIQLLEHMKNKEASYNRYPIVYSNWQQQRKNQTEEYALDAAQFIQSKLAQKLLVRQQTREQSVFLQTTRLKDEPNLKKTQSLTKKIKKTSAVQIKKRLQGYKKRQMDKIENSQELEKLNVQSVTNEQPNWGYLPIDALFSPVTKANYTVQTKRNDQKGEIICFEIWTNGSIDPRQAIHRSVKEVIKLFLPLQLTNTNAILKKAGKTTRLKKQKKQADLLTKEEILEKSLISCLEEVVKNEDLDQKSDIHLTKKNYILQQKLDQIKHRFT